MVSSPAFFKSLFPAGAAWRKFASFSYCATNRKEGAGKPRLGCHNDLQSFFTSFGWQIEQIDNFPSGHRAACSAAALDGDDETTPPKLPSIHNGD